MISIILPMPPSTNKLWRPARTAIGMKMVATTAYKDWKAMAKREVETQRDGECMPKQFRASLLIPPGAYDGDNFIKPALDACQAGGAVVNDKFCIGGTWDVDDTREGTVRIDLIPV